MAQRLDFADTRSGDRRYICEKSTGNQIVSISVVTETPFFPFAGETCSGTWQSLENCVLMTHFRLSVWDFVSTRHGICIDYKNRELVKYTMVFLMSCNVCLNNLEQKTEHFLYPVTVNA